MAAAATALRAEAMLAAERHEVRCLLLGKRSRVTGTAGQPRMRVSVAGIS